MSKYIKQLATLFLIVLSSNAFAENKVRDFSLIFAGRALHLGSSGLNENNQIVGLRYKSFEASTMINSFDHRSYSLSYHKKWFWNEWVDLGVRVGGMTGYRKDENKYQLAGISPLGAPTLDLHYKNLGVEVSLANLDVLVFQLNLSF